MTSIKYLEEAPYNYHEHDDTPLTYFEIVVFHDPTAWGKEEPYAIDDLETAIATAKRIIKARTPEYKKLVCNIWKYTVYIRDEGTALETQECIIKLNKSNI